MPHPYTTPQFAASLNHYGKSCDIPPWNTNVLLRNIDDAVDACGTYPITILSPDCDINAGLSSLQEHGAISLVMVCDDFHRPELNELEKYFDVVRPFKEHYIHRPDKPFEYHRYHRRKVRQGLKNSESKVFNLKDFMKEWVAMYDHLVSRHGLAGLHAFPASHFEALAELSGIHAIGTWIDGKLESCHLWVEHVGMVHSHLTASTDKGYENSAAYASNDFALQHFKDAKVINFGGGAGNSTDADDGLAKFKQGFANDAARSYICGKILDKTKYTEIVQKHGLTLDTNYFPAYRAPK